MTYDASNRRDVRRAESLAQQFEANRINHISGAMDTYYGRAWFYDLLEACHIFADPFTGDALREAYVKGERNVGLKLFADIMAHAPDQYIQMMREANDRRTSFDKLARSQGTGRDTDQPTPGPGPTDRDAAFGDPDDPDNASDWDPYADSPGSD